MFKRDAVQIMEAARKSPEVTAQAIIFAIVTANATLKHAVNTALWILRKGDAFLELTYEDLTVADKSYMASAMTRNKFAFVQYVLKNRRVIYAKYQELEAIEFWHYLLDSVPGLGMVKAGFVVQMLYNELACIDIHNLRVLGVEKKLVEGKSKKRREGYLELQARKTSEEWWDSWVALVAEKYPYYYHDADEVSRLHVKAVMG